IREVRTCLDQQHAPAGLFRQTACQYCARRASTDNNVVPHFTWIHGSHFEKFCSAEERPLCAKLGKNYANSNNADAGSVSVPPSASTTHCSMQRVRVLGCEFR